MKLRFIVTAIFVWFSFAALAFAGDPFTVAGVGVDATGDNAIDAQTTAISEGQAKAAQILLKRLTLAEQRASQNVPEIPQEMVAKMIRALEIANEKRSTQRYLGDITVAFSPTQVQQYLQSKGMTMVSSQAEKRLVVPILSGAGLWAENDWHKSWKNGGFENSLTPMEPIDLTLGNDSLMSASQASSLDMDALKRLGGMFGARQVLVVKAEPALGGIRVTMNDISVDSGLARNMGTISAGSYDAAARAVSERLEDDWKSASVTLAQNAVSMPVSVLYKSHGDWLNLQSVINNSAQIQGARLDALSKDGALMTITYGGDFNRLQNELGYKGVEVKQDAKLGTILYRKGRY